MDETRDRSKQAHTPWSSRLEPAITANQSSQDASQWQGEDTDVFSSATDGEQRRCYEEDDERFAED
jgi:hypothetical protein